MYITPAPANLDPAWLGYLGKGYPVLPVPMFLVAGKTPTHVLTETPISPESRTQPLPPRVIPVPFKVTEKTAGLVYFKNPPDPLPMGLLPLAGHTGWFFIHETAVKFCQAADLVIQFGYSLGDHKPAFPPGRGPRNPEPLPPPFENL